MGYDIEKQNVIEPEIIIEDGENLSNHKPAPGLLGGFRGITIWALSAIAGLLTSILMFALFLAAAVIIAVPALVLSLFGKKPNIKIFKYKI
jgi:hypothetical protein